MMLRPYLRAFMRGIQRHHRAQPTQGLPVCLSYYPIIYRRDFCQSQYTSMKSNKRKRKIGNLSGKAPLEMRRRIPDDPVSLAVLNTLSSLASQKFIHPHDIDELFDRYPPLTLDPYLFVDVVRVLSTKGFAFEARHLKLIGDFLSEKWKDLDSYQLDTDMSVEIERIYSLLKFGIFYSTPERPYQMKPFKLAGLLSNLRSQHSQVVNEMLRAVTQEILDSPMSFYWNGKDIARGLHGMKYRADCEIYRGLLAAIVSRIDPKAVFSTFDIVNILHGVQGMSMTKEVRDIFNVFQPHIDSGGLSFTCRDIAATLYSLHSKSCSEPEVTALLKSMTRIIRSRTDNRTVLKPLDVGSGLFGLQRMSSDTYEVRELISAFEGLIYQSNVKLTSRAIGDSLYGLQGMNPEVPEVAQLLHCLATCIENATDKLCGKHMGKALLGLKNMSSDNSAVRSLISALAKRISTPVSAERLKGSWYMMNSQAVASTLFGMQNMSNNCEEVKALVEAVSKEMHDHVDHVVLENEGVCNSFFGLRNMTLSPDVKLILTSLTAMTSKISEPLAVSHITPGVYGFKSMYECDEVVLALQALERVLHTSIGTVTGKAVAQLCYGLQGLSDIDVVQSMLSIIYKKAITAGLILEPRDVAMVLYGLQLMYKGRETSTAVSNMLELCGNSLIHSHPKDYNHITVAIILRRMADISSNPDMVAKTMAAVTRSLQHQHVTLTPYDMAMCLYGLRLSNSREPYVQDLIASLLDVRPTEGLTASGVSTAICGMQNLNSHNPVVKELILYLATQLEPVVSTLTSHEIAIATLGMKHLSSEHPEVRELLILMSDAIGFCNEKFSNQDLSIMFEGLSSSNDRSEESIRVLHELANRLERASGQWTVCQLSSILRGLQGFSSRSQDIKRVLRYLKSTIQTSTADMLDSVNMCNIFYGLQRMDCTDDDVIGVLHALGDKPVVDISQIMYSGDDLALSRSLVSEIDALRDGVVGLASICQIYTATISPVHTAATMRVRSISVLYHHITTLINSAEKIIASYSIRGANFTDVERENTLETLGDILRGLQLLHHFSPTLPAESTEALCAIKKSIVSILSAACMKSSGLGVNKDRGIPNSLVEALSELSNQLLFDFKIEQDVIFGGEADMSKFGFYFPGVVTVAVNNSEVSVSGRIALLIEDPDTKTYPGTRRLQFLKEKYVKEAHNIDVVRVDPSDTNIEVVNKVEAMAKKLAATKAESQLGI